MFNVDMSGVDTIVAAVDFDGAWQVEISRLYQDFNGDFEALLRNIAEVYDQFPILNNLVSLTVKYRPQYLILVPGTNRQSFDKEMQNAPRYFSHSHSMEYNPNNRLDMAIFSSVVALDVMKLILRRLLPMTKVILHTFLMADITLHKTEAPFSPFSKYIGVTFNAIFNYFSGTSNLISRSANFGVSKLITRSDDIAKVPCRYLQAKSPKFDEEKISILWSAMHSVANSENFQKVLVVVYDDDPDNLIFPALAQFFSKNSNLIPFVVAGISLKKYIAAENRLHEDFLNTSVQSISPRGLSPKLPYFNEIIFNAITRITCRASEGGERRAISAAVSSGELAAILSSEAQAQVEAEAEYVLVDHT